MTLFLALTQNALELRSTASPTGKGSLSSPIPSSPTRLHIVADDLTGACDAAAPFAARGAATRVLLAPPFAADQSQVQSLCTATRDLPSDQAVATLRSVLEPLAASRHAEPFKKIDSVFRGNTLLEIAATLAAFPGHLAVIAPAFPTQGRLCTEDHLHLSDLTGLRTLPLRALFTAAGLLPHWLPPAEDPTLLASAMRNAPSVFCEATTHHHLQTIVQAATSTGRPILWIGSSGLAHALAESHYPTPLPRPALKPLPGHPIILTGSDHPVTHRQLAALPPHTRILRIERNQTPAAEIRAFVSTNPHSALILIGGDTALHVCRALAITSLCLHSEYAPGTPLGYAQSSFNPDSPHQGTPILLKSGGFGESGLLLRIAKDLQS